MKSTYGDVEKKRRGEREKREEENTRECFLLPWAPSFGCWNWPLLVADSSASSSLQPPALYYEAHYTKYLLVPCRMQRNADKTREKMTRGDGTPVFDQTSRDRHPAIRLVPEPRLELSQVTWPAPTASGCQGIEIGVVQDAKLLATLASLSPLQSLTG